MSSILLSHLDTLNKQSYINTGSKLELAGVVAGVMADWHGLSRGEFPLLLYSFPAIQSLFDGN